MGVLCWYDRHYCSVSAASLRVLPFHVNELEEYCRFTVLEAYWFLLQC